MIYLKDEFLIGNPERVKSAHIRQYIKYIQSRGKYTVTNNERSKKVNFPENRTDFKKTVSNITINNYLRNIRVFFNYLQRE